MVSDSSKCVRVCLLQQSVSCWGLELHRGLCMRAASRHGVLSTRPCCEYRPDVLSRLLLTLSLGGVALLWEVVGPLRGGV